ncbi:MAG: glycosyltransferase family 2 protein [Acidobacteria bacterium]|jgi:glycosyltransferase involved in cell wall biosynthesis|nr:glycosyltransferase family 2 protein [Acidobacteriota bacterium]
MPRLSLIMPVKDGAAFVEAAVGSLQAQDLRDWELVVVDDGSRDATARLVAALAAADPRVRLEASPGSGQVAAINRGFGLCGGDFVKVMDADDLLAPGFSAAWPRLAAEEASYHDALLLADAADRPGRLRVGPRFRDMDLETSLRRIRVSPPRWSWTLSRRVAERVFPLPEGLPTPHEDVFIGLAVKKAARVAYVPRPLYIYRQHPGQFYGGLFNHSAAAVARRAKAMAGVIDFVAGSGIVRGVADADGLLAGPRAYFDLLGRERVSWGDIARAPLGWADKVRAAVIRKAPGLASRLSRWRATGGRT